MSSEKGANVRLHIQIENTSPTTANATGLEKNTAQQINRRIKLTKRDTRKRDKPLTEISETRAKTLVRLNLVDSLVGATRTARIFSRTGDKPKGTKSRLMTNKNTERKFC